MTVKLLTEKHLEFLSIKGGCTGSSESTLVKMPHCWNSHVAAHLSPFHRQRVVGRQVRIQRGGQVVRTPLENDKSYGFL